MEPIDIEIIENIKAMSNEDIYLLMKLLMTELKLRDREEKH